MSEQRLNNQSAPTQSYLSVEEAIKSSSGDELEGFRQKLKPVFSHDDQRGMLIFESGELTDIEVFDNPEYWDKVSEHMMESNLIDVLSLKKENENEINKNLD